MKLKSLLLTLLVLYINTIYCELKIHKKVLENGLTILVLPKTDIPQVMLNMVVGVGSKDEEINEKGIAHLIEHMFFKGTTSYSETDIDKIIYKLSGKMNAATSQDWTRYWFYVPSIYWKEILPLMAELMHACSFKDEHIDSEFKVVIQELKMRNDNYHLTLWEELLKLIFTPHPYSHPIIGYKEDIWNLHSQDLRNFYNKHYHPNNAVLVIVGDVVPEEVFEACGATLSILKPKLDHKRGTFPFVHDIVSKTVTIYRAVNHPIVVNGYCLPKTTSYNIDLY
jgi:zinc protease